MWYGYTWDYELWEQFNARLDRQGQKHPVLLHVIFINNKTELAMQYSLEQNGVTQEKLMDYMRKGD